MSAEEPKVDPVEVKGSAEDADGDDGDAGGAAPDMAGLEEMMAGMGGGGGEGGAGGMGGMDMSALMSMLGKGGGKGGGMGGMGGMGDMMGGMGGMGKGGGKGQQDDEGEQAGGDGKWQWSQKDEAVHVRIALDPPATNKKDVDVKFKSTSIVVKIRGEEVMNSQLGGKVEIDDCTWCFSPAKDELQLMLTKVEGKVEKWNALLV